MFVSGNFYGGAAAPEPRSYVPGLLLYTPKIA